MAIVLELLNFSSNCAKNDRTLLDKFEI